MKILALDLSLTATGAVVVEETGEERPPVRVLARSTIAPTDRRRNESTGAWNARRFNHFATVLGDIVKGEHPDIIVTEVTEHFYHVTGGSKGKKSSKATEYRAGYGLGRAAGWLDATCTLLSNGAFILDYEQITASEVKLRVAGAMAADKTAVKDGLQTYFGLETPGWPESQVDALAVAVAWLRNRDNPIRALSEGEMAVAKPTRARVRARVTG